MFMCKNETQTINELLTIILNNFLNLELVRMKVTELIFLRTLVILTGQYILQNNKKSILLMADV